MYDLIDQELKSYYIVAYKYMFLISLGLCLSFIITAFIIMAFSELYTAMFAFSVIFAIVSLIFFISWNINKKKYGNKISYTDDVITIYDYNNLKVKEFKLKHIKKKHLKVGFDHKCPLIIFRSCLVLYLNSEPRENMEYSSYWNDYVIIQNSEPRENMEYSSYWNDFVIIQNAESIDIIDKIIE